MTNIIILLELILDLIASILLYYGKIFRSKEKIEQMSKHSSEEIIHRKLETKLSYIGTNV